MGKARHWPLWVAGGVTGLFLWSAQGWAQVEPNSPSIDPQVAEETASDDLDYYNRYRPGYTNETYGDDWFYDYYQYDPNYTDTYDYNYQENLFDWEEQDLFEE